MWPNIQQTQKQRVKELPQQMTLSHPFSCQRPFFPVMSFFRFPWLFFPLPCRYILAFSALLTFLREEKPEEEEFILLTRISHTEDWRWGFSEMPATGAISHDYIKESIAKIGRQIHRMEKSQSAGMPAFFIWIHGRRYVNTCEPPS